jgi:hypothetical protein
MARQNLYGHFNRLGLDHAQLRAGAEQAARSERP